MFCENMSLLFLLNVEINWIASCLQCFISTCFLWNISFPAPPKLPPHTTGDWFSFFWRENGKHLIEASNRAFSQRLLSLCWSFLQTQARKASLLSEQHFQGFTESHYFENPPGLNSQVLLFTFTSLGSNFFQIVLGFSYVEKSICFLLSGKFVPLFSPMLTNSHSWLRLGEGNRDACFHSFGVFFFSYLPACRNIYLVLLQIPDGKGARVRANLTF